MSDSTNWVDWHPQVGDVRPKVYRWLCKIIDKDWNYQSNGCGEIDKWNVENNIYQIPAPKETAMKYWQPRIEPMQKVWTLADVPFGVRCDVVLPGGKKAFASADLTRTVWSCGVDAECLPSECRVIRVIDPLPAGAMTLDKVPEGVRCVVDFDGTQRVCKKIREAICGSDGVIYVPQRGAVISVLHILDPLPELSVTIDTLPVGRVIEQLGNRYWKCEQNQWLCGVSGVIFRASPCPSEFQVTDIIMELKEVV